MRIKPITIKIQEGKDGQIKIETTITHKDGESKGVKIILASLDRKIEAITDTIRDTLMEYIEDGTLEELSTSQKDDQLL